MRRMLPKLLFPFLPSGLALLAATCGPSLAVDISILNANADTDILVLQVSYGETSKPTILPEQRVPLGAGRVWLNLPPEAEGTIKLDVLALNRDGCSLGRGVSQTLLQKPVTPLPLSLQDSATPACPIKVIRSGGAAAKVTSDNLGIDCGATCAAYFSGSVKLLAHAERYAPFQKFVGCDRVSGTTCFLDDTRRPRQVLAEFGDLCASGGACTEPSPVSVNLNAIAGSGPRDIWAVGDNGTAVHFDGVNWTAQNTGLPCSLRAVFVPAANRAWAVGDSLCVARWTGTRWDNLTPTLTPTSDLSVVAGSPGEDQSFVGGGAMLYRTSPAPAASWSLQTPRRITGLARTLDGEFFAVTSDRTALRWDPTMSDWVIEQSSITSSPSIPVGLTPGSSSSLWTLEPSGFVRRQGNAWTPVPCQVAATLGSGVLRGLWSSEGQRIWAVGANSSIVACEPTTGSLQRYPAPGVARSLFGVYGAAGDGIYVVGAAGTILRVPTP